ncbi:MAG: NUDIX domain-containing protein [bacterium]
MKPKISTIIKTRSSGDLKAEYYDAKELSIPDSEVHHVCTFAFYGGKLVLCHDAQRNKWTPPGGSKENGESVQEATIREVLEESNMKVVYYELLGYQKVYEPHRVTVQTRSFCVVEPCGKFVSDPDGDIDEIELIDPKDIKKYFDWSEIGDEVLRCALEKLNKINNGKII